MVGREGSYNLTIICENVDSQIIGTTVDNIDHVSNAMGEWAPQLIN